MKPKNIVLLGCTGSISVNRCGCDPNVEYPGRSHIISTRGEVIPDAGETEGAVHAELDFTALEAYRQEFPTLQDMRQPGPSARLTRLS